MTILAAVEQHGAFARMLKYTITSNPYNPNHYTVDYHNAWKDGWTKKDDELKRFKQDPEHKILTHEDHETVSPS